MDYAGFGWGFGQGLIGMFAHVVGAVFWMIGFSIAGAVLFVLLRFLIIATRAAQLYIAQNEPRRQAADPETAATPATPAKATPAEAAPAKAAPAKKTPAAKAAPKSAAAPAAAPKSTTKPATTKKRAPKAPPAS